MESGTQIRYSNPLMATKTHSSKPGVDHAGAFFSLVQLHGGAGSPTSFGTSPSPSTTSTNAHDIPPSTIGPPFTGTYDIPPPTIGLPSAGAYSMPPPTIGPPSTGAYDTPPPTTGPPSAGTYGMPPPTLGLPFAGTYDTPL
ncbi:hypothetical protein BDR04DRAFT_1161867 [Suillus decipiens]|nr:hypothetical protein BDR04DRAFT_1161867 [Suillus decipiens]